MNDDVAKRWMGEVTEKLDEFNKGTLMEAYDYLDDLEGALAHALQEGLGKKAFERVALSSIATDERLRWPFMGRAERARSVSWGMELDLERLHHKTQAYVRKKGTTREARARFMKALLSHPGTRHVLNDIDLGLDAKGEGVEMEDGEESEGEEEEREAELVEAEREGNVLTPKGSFLARVEEDLAQISAQSMSKKKGVSKAEMMNSIMERLPGWSDDIFGPGTAMGVSAAPSAAKSRGQDNRDDGQPQRPRPVRRTPRRRPTVIIADEDEEGTTPMETTTTPMDTTSTTTTTTTTSNTETPVDKGKGKEEEKGKEKEEEAPGDEEFPAPLPGAKEAFDEMDKMLIERFVKAKVGRAAAEFAVGVMRNVTDQDDMKMEIDEEEWVMVLTYKNKPSDEVANVVRIDLTTKEGMDKLKGISDKMTRQRIKDITVQFISIRDLLQDDAELSGGLLDRVKRYLLDPFDWKWSKWDGTERRKRLLRKFLQVTTKVVAVMGAMYTSLVIAWALFEMLNRSYGSGKSLPHDFVERKVESSLNAVTSWAYSFLDSIMSKSSTYAEMPFLERVFYSWFVFPTKVLPKRYDDQFEMIARKKELLGLIKPGDVRTMTPSALKTVRDKLYDLVLYYAKWEPNEINEMKVVVKYVTDPEKLAREWVKGTGLDDLVFLSDQARLAQEYQQCLLPVFDIVEQTAAPASNYVCVDPVVAMAEDFAREQLPRTLAKLDAEPGLRWYTVQDNIVADAEAKFSNKSSWSTWIRSYTNKLKNNVSNVKETVDMMTGEVSKVTVEDFVVEGKDGFLQRVTQDDDGLRRITGRGVSQGFAANLEKQTPFTSFTFMYKVWSVCRLLDKSYIMVPKTAIFLIQQIARLIKACFRKLADWLQRWLGDKMREARNTSAGFSVGRVTKITLVGSLFLILRFAQALFWGIEWVMWVTNLMLGFSSSSPRWILFTMGILVFTFGNLNLPQEWREKLYRVVEKVEQSAYHGATALATIAVGGVVNVAAVAADATYKVLPEALQSTSSGGVNFIGNLQRHVFHNGEWVLEKVIKAGKSIAGVGEYVPEPGELPNQADTENIFSRQLREFREHLGPNIKDSTIAAAEETAKRLAKEAAERLAEEAARKLEEEVKKAHTALVTYQEDDEGIYERAYEWVSNTVEVVTDQMPDVSGYLPSGNTIDQAFSSVTKTGSETAMSLYAQASQATSDASSSMAAALEEHPFIMGAAIVAGIALATGITYHSVRKFRQWYRGGRGPKKTIDKASNH